jgi:hypothetical protein
MVTIIHSRKNHNWCQKHYQFCKIETQVKFTRAMNYPFQSIASLHAKESTLQSVDRKQGDLETKKKKARVISIRFVSPSVSPVAEIQINAISLLLWVPPRWGEPSMTKEHYHDVKSRIRVMYTHRPVELQGTMHS